MLLKDLENIHKYDLPSRAMHVYRALEDRSGKKGYCFPSQATIAKDTHLSRSTVSRALADLKKAGLITTEQRTRFYGEKSTLTYYLKKE